MRAALLHNGYLSEKDADEIALQLSELLQNADDLRQVLDENTIDLVGLQVATVAFVTHGAAGLAAAHSLVVHTPARETARVDHPGTPSPTRVRSGARSYSPSPAARDAMQARTQRQTARAIFASLWILTTPAVLVISAFGASMLIALTGALPTNASGTPQLFGISLLYFLLAPMPLVWIAIISLCADGRLLGTKPVPYTGIPRRDTEGFWRCPSCGRLIREAGRETCSNCANPLIT